MKITFYMSARNLEDFKNFESVYASINKNENLIEVTVDYEKVFIEKISGLYNDMILVRLNGK